MNVNFWLNGVNRHAEISPDTLLIDFLRKQGCFSVKRGCETANCGLCTVLMDGRPVLSCSTLAARIEGKKIVTLEGMQREAQEFGSFLAVSYTHLDVYKRQALDQSVGIGDYYEKKNNFKSKGNY